MKGFKVFNNDWSYEEFFYEVGKIYESSEGYTFYQSIAECFSFYDFGPKNKIAEVLILGDVITEDGRISTNKFQIVREISWKEFLDMANTGENCVGYKNTGNCNDGNNNSGNHNAGNGNVGDYNIGRYNTGQWNVGYWNAGDFNYGNSNVGNENTGNNNVGNWNSGDGNTGDWNISSHNNGCFNTEEQKISLFNKPSPWTYSDWANSDACRLLNQIPRYVMKWVPSEEMTSEEKVIHTEHEITGGYLKGLDESECSQRWWDELTVEEKEIIKSIPNFDADIFYECTGIRV